MMREVSHARLAEARRKLSEIRNQLASLKQQEELWAKVEKEESARIGGQPVKVARKPPTMPSMIPDGVKPSDVQVTSGEKVSVTEKPHAFTHGEPMQDAWSRPDETVPVTPKPPKQKEQKAATK